MSSPYRKNSEINKKVNLCPFCKQPLSHRIVALYDNRRRSVFADTECAVEKGYMKYVRGQLVELKPVPCSLVEKWTGHDKRRPQMTVWEIAEKILQGFDVSIEERKRLAAHALRMRGFLESYCECPICNYTEGHSTACPMPNHPCAELTHLNLCRELVNGDEQ